MGAKRIDCIPLITTLQTAINAGCEMRVEDGEDYLPCEPLEIKI